MALPASVLLRRGFVKRCPVCGHGHLFRRWVHMAPDCPGCGFRFHRDEGQWLGSWFLNVCVTQGVVLALIVGLVAVSWPERPPAVALGVAVVLAVAVPVLFFPFSRTIWAAIDLAMRPLDLHDGVAPGVELEQTAPRRGP